MGVEFSSGSYKSVPDASIYHHYAALKVRRKVLKKKILNILRSP